MSESGPTLPVRSLHVVLFQPEIAANVGAIGRTCVAVGAKLWLVRPLGFHLTDRHRRRAGLDYWDSLDWKALDSLEEVEAELGVERLWLMTTRARRLYSEVAYRPGDGLVFGPESRGLPDRLLAEREARAIRIPMRATARSLNLACAVAAAAYEARRQIGLDWEDPARRASEAR
jgi:tRNA (cytidine/uridine-2'-O-)-methyltransferase